MMNTNDVREIADMQKHIDDYDRVHDYISEIVKTGSWKDYPSVSYFPRCGELMHFLEYLCEEHPSVFKEYEEYLKVLSQEIQGSTKPKGEKTSKKSKLTDWLRFG